MSADFRKVLLGIALLLIVGIGYLYFQSTPKPVEPSLLSNDETKEFADESNVTKCEKSERYPIDPALDESINLLMTRANDHVVEDLGITAEKLGEGGQEEFLSTLQQMMKDPLGHVLWSYHSIENCIEFKYASEINGGSSVSLNTDNAPNHVVIEVTDKYKEDRTLTSLLLTDKLSQAVSWFQVEPKNREVAEQCYTDKARGLALQLGYLVTSLQEESDLGEKIIAASEESTEIDQLNIAFINLLAVDPPNYNLSEYRDLAEQYVRDMPYFKNQCPIIIQS